MRGGQASLRQLQNTWRPRQGAHHGVRELLGIHLHVFDGELARVRPGLQRAPARRSMHLDFALVVQMRQVLGVVLDIMYKLCRVMLWRGQGAVLVASKCCALAVHIAISEQS